MKKQAPSVTHEQIRRALRQFELAGGCVRSIPPERTPRNGRVLLHGSALPGWESAAATRPAMSEAVAAALQ